MTIDKAKVLLCQMYLPQFDEEEKQALTMAIEALEELKEYKLKEFQCHLAREEGITIGYNKAIDDFAEQFIYKAVCEGCSGCCGCYEECRQSECEDYKYYMQIAEQLKAGGIDGNEKTDT